MQTSTISLLVYALFLAAIGSGCVSSPYFSNSTAVGILNNNGFGPGNTWIGIVDQKKRLILPLVTNQNNEIWSYLSKAETTTAHLTPGSTGLELRLEALGAGGARVTVTPDDIMFLELGVDRPDAVPEDAVDSFRAKGLFNFLQRVQVAGPEIPF